VTVKYEIYGYNLQLNFINDFELFNHFNNFVGCIIPNDTEKVIGSFTFVKTTPTYIDNNYKNNKIDCNKVQEAYVQPTGERSEVFIDEDNKTTIHYYKNYYLVEYIYAQQKVNFYYTENFYYISSLLMEFFKYYIFYISVENELFPLHSSCISDRNRNDAILFVGNSGAGKSSNALLTTFKTEYSFNNDEITYISKVDNNFLANPTNDKIKICEEMLQSLINLDIEFEYVKLDDEYVCNLRNRTSDEYNNNLKFDINTLFLLERDDSLSDIVVSAPNIIKRGELLFQNMHISVWTTKTQKRKIIHFVNDMISKLKFIHIMYPTNMINKVSDFVFERSIDGISN